MCISGMPFPWVEHFQITPMLTTLCQLYGDYYITQQVKIERVAQWAILTTGESDSSSSLYEVMRTRFFLLKMACTLCWWRAISCFFSEAPSSSNAWYILWNRCKTSQQILFWSYVLYLNKHSISMVCTDLTEQFPNILLIYLLTMMQTLSLFN